jgi:Ion channel
VTGRGGTNVLRQLAFGGGISIINITIHSLVMAMLVRIAQLAAAKPMPHPSLHLAGVMIPIVSVLMATHALEVVVWSIAYGFVDAAPDEADLVYFAFVNYTTLGYGDIVPLPRWRLLGPLTAMNGVLLFGWSTAVIFDVLRRTMERGADAEPLD